MSTGNLLEELKDQRSICEEILALSRQESQSPGGAGEATLFAHCQTRRALLPRLNGSLEKLRLTRAALVEKSSVPAEALQLMRHNQDLIMRILMIDRENEQALLRRGLVPARHLPAAGRQRPHFVADLYRRTGLGSANANREDCHH